MYFLISACENPDILRVIYLIKLGLQFVFVIVPIALIVLLCLDFTKIVTSRSDEDMKKFRSLAIRRILVAMSVFSVPNLINLVVSLVNSNTSYLSCLTNATPKVIEKYQNIKDGNKTSDSTTTNNVVNPKSDKKKKTTPSTYVSSYDGKFGSVGTLTGTTVIVSIFANESTTKWTSKDKNLMNETVSDLKIATDWLTKSARKYGSTTKFIYDWKTNADLKYEPTFKEHMTVLGYDHYEVQKKYIQDNIDSDKLKSKYQADNILYIFFFNTSYDLQELSFAAPHWNSSSFDIEIINIFMKSMYSWNADPATYAHEILHLFGAPDLYTRSSLITDEYVYHCNTTYTNDIMYDNEKNTKEIKSAFTDLDAYYVGIGKAPSDVKEWNLGKSEKERGY